MKKQWLFALACVLVAGCAWAATYNFPASTDSYMEKTLTESLDNVTMDNGTADGATVLIQITQDDNESFTIDAWPTNFYFTQGYQVSAEYDAVDTLQFAYDNSTASWRQVGKTARSVGTTVKKCTGTCTVGEDEWGDDILWTNDNTTQVSATITLPAAARGRVFNYKHAAIRNNTTVSPASGDTVNGKTTGRTVKDYGALLHCVAMGTVNWVCTSR